MSDAPFNAVARRAPAAPARTAALFLLGLFTLASAAYLAREPASVILHGEKVAGEVIDIATVEDTQGQPGGYTPVIAYTDTSGERFTFLAPHPKPRPCCERGERVAVYYDRRDHGRAALAQFADFWTLPLLAASAGALLLLMAGISAAQPGERRTRAAKPVEASRMAAGPGDERLQFHPLNRVSVRQYLAHIAPPETVAKVQIVEAAVALRQGRVPVVLAEFLAHMCAMAANATATAGLQSRCPHLRHLRAFEADEARAIAFLFEETGFIIIASPGVSGPLGALASVATPKAGARKYVPAETVWNAAPRFPIPARAWDGLRAGVDKWAEEAMERDSARPFVFAGHGEGGAAAVIAAYEFKKRGRNMAAVLTFGAPPAGGRAFAAEYHQLGLDERTLNVSRETDVPLSARPPFSPPPAGQSWSLAQAKLLPRTAAYGAAPTTGLAARAVEILRRDLEPGARKRRSLAETVRLFMLASFRRAREEIAAFDIQCGYALSLSVLSSRRLLELLAPDGAPADLELAREALAQHLGYIAGIDADQRAGSLQYLEDLPAFASAAALGAAQTVLLGAASAKDAPLTASGADFSARTSTPA